MNKIPANKAILKIMRYQNLYSQCLRKYNLIGNPETISVELLFDYVDNHISIADKVEFCNVALNALHSEKLAGSN